MANNKVMLMVAEGCGPCAEIPKEPTDNVEVHGAHVLSKGDVEVKVVDVTSEQGFDHIAKYGIEGVPQAVLENDRGDFQVCPVRVEGGRVIVECEQGE